MAVLWVMYGQPAGRRAIVVSAGLAFLVQMASFAVALPMARTNVFVGWGLGMAVRVVALTAYALVAVPQLGLPSSTALATFVLFLFLSTLVEPLFLKP